VITGGTTESQNDPLQPPAVDRDPTFNVGWFWKLMPIGVPFDASPQFGALSVTAASWNVIGPFSAKAHGSFAGVTTLATACAWTTTFRLVPLQLVVKITNDSVWG
jgi:hypothetical protein